jgi:N-methylhydantoinase A
MGGTSFDTGLVLDGEAAVRRTSRIGRFRTALPLVDVTSVGAGGGSIAWISERGVPQVGPRSAGSTPGPAAYGRGGEEPTVTDAMVAMDFIDAENYLGGRLRLDRERAREALRRGLAEPLGWEVEQAAAAVHDLVVAGMANAVREVTVGRGQDPRDFLFLAYGGTLPWFAMEIARVLDIDTVVVPADSSVFCARGLLSSDFLLRADTTVQAFLDNAEEIDRINALAGGMVAAAAGQMRDKGFADADIEVARSGEIQFAGQVHGLSVPLPAGPLGPTDVERLEADFLRRYEATYGVGTAWPGAPLQMLDYTVSVTGRLARPDHPTRGEAATETATARGSREVYLPGAQARRSVTLYDEAEFTPGSRLQGPALIEAVDTTIFVPDGAGATRDAQGSIVMRRTQR